MFDLSKVFYYDETSPSCLRWAIDVGSGRGHQIINVQRGDVAGTLGMDGYWTVRYQGVDYKAHRVVLELAGKFIDGCFVDHVDGVKSNNIIDNLRLVDHRTNMRNKSLYSSNKTGTTGVFRKDEYRHKYGRTDEYYVASWYDHRGKQRYKMFNIGKFGDELALFLACEYRQHQIDLLNLYGAGYTDRHGT